MNANVPSTGLVGTWVQVSGSSEYTVDDINSPTALYTNLVPGNYVFKWVVKRGTCDEASSEMSFKVSLPATVATVTTTPLSVCGTSTTLTGNTITAGIGTWQVVSGPNNPTIANYNAGNSPISNLTTGTYVLNWVSKNGPACAASSATLTLKVSAAADAGPDQNLCDKTEVLLQGTQGSTGIWSQTSAFPSTLTRISPSTYRATITPGLTYTFQYFIEGDGCPDSSDTMTVTNSALPTKPNAGADQSICLSGGNSINLDGNPIVVGTGKWSIVSGPSGATITTPSLFNSEFKGLTEGLYILNWTASNGTCNDFNDVVRINAYEPPSIANAGADQTACQLATQLDAVAPTKGIGKWTLTTDPSSGGIVIDSPNDPKSKLTIANPYLLPVGDYIFTWTVSNGPVCAVSTDTVIISYTGAPPTPANAGPDQKLCGVSTAVMNANPVNPGTGTWSQVSGPSTAVFSNKFLAKSAVSGLTEGEYLFKWTSSNGGCNLEDTMKITISPAVANVEAGPDQTVNEFDAINMAAINPAPNTGTWTFVSGPNTPVILDSNSPTTQIAGTIPGTYVFRFTVSNDTCDNVSDTVSITIIGKTDLSLSKSASTLVPKVGDIVTFTVAVKNEGNRDASGIAVSDVLPAGLSLVAGTVSNAGTYNVGNNSINWSGLTVADKATLNLTYKVKVNAPTGVANEYKNTAQITASNLVDPNSTPNNNVPTEDDQSSVTLAPTPTVDIVIIKTANTTTPKVGSTITFTLEVKNNGPSNATGVTVTDIIPSGYTYNGSSSTTGTIDSSSPATTGLVWNIGALDKDATVTMSITAIVKATGTYTNSASVVSTSTETDTNTTNNTSSVTPIPVAVANLSLTKGISPVKVEYEVGSEVTFTVNVNNAGPSNATAVSVVDYLPSGYTYVSHTATGNYDRTSGAWTIGTIANGANATLAIVAKVNASGDYRNVAEIIHSDQIDSNSTPGNNVLAEDDQEQVVITVKQIADLTLSKTVDNTSPRVGDNVKFIVALSNAGPSDATAVTVNDKLPVGYTFVSYTSTSGTYNSGSGDWTLSGKVLNGKTEYLEIVAKVNAPTNTLNQYRNTAQVTASGTTDPTSTSNDGTGDDFSFASTIPTPLIDLSLTKAVDNVSPLVGSNVTFTIRVANAGPSTATGIQVKDIMRSGYTFVSASATSGTIDSSDPTAGGLLWSIPTQLTGGNAVLTVVATVNPTGDFKNVAQIIAANETDIDSTPNNNVLAEDDQDEVTTSQVPLIDLSLTKVVDIAEPNVGDNVGFTITVKNTGPSAATGVVVTDKLPTGYQYVGFTATQGNYVPTTGSWTIGAMPSSSTAVVTLKITAKVLAEGNYNNIAEVTGADQVDSNSTPANNDSEETDQDEAFVTPKPIADLSVTKSVNVSNPVVGKNVVFTIAVANAGPSTATGVIIEDKLPSGYEFVSAVPSIGMYNATSGLWTVSRPIVAGFSESIQITAKVLATGNYSNTASVNASGQTDPISTNNTAVTTTTPTASVDLVVVKRINNTTPDVGALVTFTVDVTNNGPSAATAVIVNDKLQSGYAYSSDTSGGSYDAGTGVWTIGTLASGTTTSLTISATVNAAGDYGNTATASSFEAESTPANNTTTISSTPRAVAKLSLTKMLMNGPLKVGENAIFEIVVTNAGPSDATGVAVLDKLPSGFEFVSATPPGTSTYDDITGAWGIGAIANGATATIRITATILATGNYTNVAEISASNQFDPNSIPGNNNPIEDDQSQVTVRPEPIADLSVVKTANTLAPAVGSNVVFTVVVKNEGPSAATGVVLKDVLASGYQFVSAVPSSGLYTVADGLWTLSRPIASGTSETIQITAKVLATGVYKNDAQVTNSDQLDPDSTPDDGAGDDFATVTPVPTALVDLVVVKRINDAVPNVGATIAFTIVVTNNGPSTATSVLVNDKLKSGYTYLSHTGGAYDAGTGVWTIGTLASGSSTTLNISATVNAAGDYGNTATASSLEAESTPANNLSTVLSTPRPVASLSLNKAIVNAPLKIGDNAIFELVVTNAGPSDATGVAVVDKLPSGFTFVSATPPGTSTYNSTTGAWDIGAIANGATATMRITATVLATGNYTNVAEISASNEYDLNSIPGNNNPLEDDQSQVTVIPEKIADLSLLKKVDVATPRVGDNVKFTLELNNAGPSDATAVVVNDLLPSGYSVVSYTTTSGSYDADSGDWTLSGNVLKDKKEFLEIVAKVNPITGAANEYKNNAQVAESGTKDPDSTPNDGIGDDFSTASTVPTALIDLSLTKSVDIVSPVVGSNVVFTIKVANAGPSTATGIEVTDVLPSGYTFVSATPSATYNGTIWTIPSIAKGSSATLTITAKVNASGIYKNVAEVTKAIETDIDSTPGNNLLAEDDQDEVTTSQIPLIDLSLNKSILGGSTPNVGQNVTFRIRVANAGPSTATGVVVTDKLPTGYAFVSATPSQGTYVSTSGSWTVGNVVNAGSASIDIVAKVLATGNYNNIAEVTGANEVDSNSTPGNNDATENDQMEVVVKPMELADLSVVKTVDNETPVVGSNVVFTINVKNEGPSTATGVVIQDVLRSGYEFVSATPTAGVYNRTTGLWTVSRPIVQGTTESILITAKVLATGDYGNTALINASNQTDPVTTNNSSTINTTPSALVDLVVAKRISNARPDVGSTVVFTVDVTNNGPSAATSVVVTDQLLSGYTYSSDTGAGAYSAGTGLWTIGTLANGATRTLTITATVNAVGDYGNTAKASSTEADSNLANNSTTISSLPRAVADLRLTKEVQNQSINVGQNAVFNLVITNAGPSAATNVVITDKLPSGYAFVSAIASGTTTYSSTSGAWFVGSLANGATATLSMTVKVLATGEYTNVAQVTGSDQFDPNSIPNNNNPGENDQAQAFVTPINEANLVTVKTVLAVNVAGISASNPNEGDTIKYRLVVTNNGGPTNATAVSLTDLLPAGVTFVSYNATSGVYNYGSGIWTIGNINVNSSATLEITVKVNVGTKGTTITNVTTAAKGDQTDPSTVGDDLTETIVVSKPPVATNDSNNGNTPNNPSKPIIIVANDILQDGTQATPAKTIVDLDPSTPGADNSLFVPGQGTWNYNPTSGVLIFNPITGFTADPTPLVYKLIEAATGLSSTATVTVDYDILVPKAFDDVSNGNPINTAVTVNPLINNGLGVDADPDGSIIASTVSLVVPTGATSVVTDANGDVTSFDVPGEGKWSVNPISGLITFTPLATFHKDPTPVQYNVEDNDGNQSNNATVTIDYVPVATNDKNSVPGTAGSPVVINVITNDITGDLVKASTVVLNASSVGGVQVSPNEVTLAGVGKWVADASGNVTFTPVAGYTLDPPVISYTVKDDEGNSSNAATITIDYAPISRPNVSTGNPINTPVVVSVIANDTTGDLVDPTTVSLVNPGNATNIVTDANGDITSLVIPGEGTWNVDLVTGAVTFTPNPGFITNPTPINYNVEDRQGNQSNNSLITIQMVAQADLVVTKTDNKEKYTPGTNSVYTIVVKNNGPAVATNVVVLDDIISPILEAVTTWSAVGTGSAVPPNATGTGDITAANATIATVAVGESVTYTVTIAVPSSFTGQISNTASATSALQDPNLANNSQTDIDTMNALAEIALTKTIVGATTHYVGDNLTFLISAINNGPSDATGINVVDKLPSGYSFVSVTPTVGTYNSSNGLWDIGSLTNRSSATLTVIAKVNATGNYTNVAEVTKVNQLDPNGIIHGNNTPGEIDQADVTIVPAEKVDLVTTKTVDKSNPNQGDTIKYTLTVVNKGPSVATGVRLTDNLPVGTAYVAHVATGGTVNTYSGGLWTIGNMNSGSSATLVIEAKVTAAGTAAQTPIVNTTTAATGNELDPTTVGDDLTEPITVTSADLVTEKTVSNSNPGETETITYTIKVTNNGPNLATAVRVTDILPIGVTYISNNLGGDYNYGSGLWTVGDIAVGATKVLNINVTPNLGTAGKTIINTTTAAKGDQSDPTTLDDDLNESIVVKNSADIVLTKTVDNNAPNIGDIISYTVTVTNNGPIDVTNLVIKDKLPAGLSFFSATPGKGVWSEPNWNVGTLLPGAKASIVIKAVVGLDQGGNILLNTVSNSQDQTDSNLTPDDPSESVTVTGLDLGVLKTVSNATPNVGETITYTIKVTNNGISDATSVSITDRLPVGVTFVSSAVTKGLYNNGSGLWTIGDLANGSIATLTIRATVNGGTFGDIITNTTSAVTSDQADSNVGNNIGSVSIVPTAFIDLSLTKEVVANVTNPAVGEVITFEVRVLNDGPSRATGVQVVDLIPSGYKFVNYSSTIGTYTPATGLWNIGFVEVGNTAVLLVDVKVLDSGNYLNCAEITKANEIDVDSTPGNGNVAGDDDYACASAPPNQSVDLAVVKTILKGQVNPKVNSAISFEILLTNNGNIDATNVVVADLLPSGYTFVNYSSTKGIYDYKTGDWKVSKIVNGDTEILIVDVIVNESGDYLNCAKIKSLTQVDTNPANNSSCVATVPVAIIDLELAKEVDILKPFAETNVEFTITLTNKGPSKGTSVQVKDLLPNGMTYVSATPSIGTYNAITGIWNVGTIGIQAVETLKVVALVLPVGDFTNVAEVIAANELDVDSTPNNNKLLEDDQDAVTLEPEISLVLSEGFTPNGDGINDVFEVQHLQVLYPNFSMEIVNRYGNIVYQYKHNGDKFKTPKWWDGYSTGRWNVSNDMLPAGTYFYTIYFNNDDRKPQTGWIYLRR